MTHEQRWDKLSSIITALLCEQQSPIFSPTMWNYQHFMVALLSKEVNCPFPFSGPPPLPSLLSPLPPFRVFSPKPQPMTRFHTLCLNRQPLLFKNPIFPPLHDFKYLHTSDRRHPPPTSSSHHQLQMLAAFVWLCGLTSRQTSPSCPCLNHRAVFSRAAVASPKSPHTRLPFSNVAV